MKISSIESLYLCTVLLLSFNGLQGQKDYYTAAVFEIAQYQDLSSSWSEIIKKNLEKYAQAAEVASTHNVDMIVYPEKGLFTRFNGSNTWNFPFAENVPDPKIESTNPCAQYDDFANSPILRNLSCFSKEHSMYVVADMTDVKKCVVKAECDKYNADYCRKSEKDCPKDGKFNFNTLVAFDRSGTLIARYYKRHLFFEDGYSIPKIPENAYFETDFGNFTADICFDLFFKDSAEGADKPGVTGLGAPVWGHDFTPLYFTVDIHQTWAMTNRINVLAANVQYPSLGSLGSGIYSAVKGALVYTANPDGKSKLLISNVPISSTEIPKDMSFDTKFYYIDEGKVSKLQGEEPRDFNRECDTNVLGLSSSWTDYRCFPLPVHQYTFIKLNETKGNINICSNKFCCTLIYEAQSMDETYYFGVSGKRQSLYDTFFLGTQACFLTRCEPLKGKPCRNFLLKSSTIFETVEIIGSFDTDYIYPFAVNSEVRLVNKDEWNFDGKSRMKYQNLHRQPLLSIGLNGRLYNRDKVLNSNDSKKKPVFYEDL